MGTVSVQIRNLSGSDDSMNVMDSLCSIEVHFGIVITSSLDILLFNQLQNPYYVQGTVLNAEDTGLNKMANPVFMKHTD